MNGNKGADLTVIVVDDCRNVRDLLRTVLEMRGYCVLEAENGQVAIELARQKCPDLILMDLHMPVIDGLSATRILREREEMWDVPIIAVSSHPKDSHRPAAIAAGCNEYVSKPIDFKHLGFLLSSLLAA